MKMSLKLRDDVLALVEEYQRKMGAAGTPMSDSGLSLLAMGYRDFVGQLRKWGGPDTKGPKLATVAQLEEWLRTQIGEKEYNAFRTRRSGGDGF